MQVGCLMSVDVLLAGVTQCSLPGFSQLTAKSIAQEALSRLGR
jgi:hypothetical protein